MTFICQFFHDIPFERSGIHNIIIRIFSMKHRKALMMTTCKADILGSGYLNSTYPFSRTKLGGIETSGKFGIFFIVQIFIGHRPLTGSQHTV